MIRFFLTILLALFISPAYSSTDSSTDSSNEFKILKWVDLIPKADLDALLNPPKFLDDIADGSAEDIIPVDPLANAVEQAIGQSKKALTPEEEAYYSALKSTNIKSEFHQQNVRIAGFIVPVEFNDDQVITEFFLVPYFGACIHVPPPPPNQIIYVTYPKGFKLETLYTPMWIEGELLAKTIENDVALSAYSLNAVELNEYTGDGS